MKHLGYLHLAKNLEGLFLPKGRTIAVAPSEEVLAIWFQFMVFPKFINDSQGLSEFIRNSVRVGNDFVVADNRCEVIGHDKEDPFSSGWKAPKMYGRDCYYYYRKKHILYTARATRSKGFEREIKKELEPVEFLGAEHLDIHPNANRAKPQHTFYDILTLNRYTWFFAHVAIDRKGQMYIHNDPIPRLKQGPRMRIYLNHTSGSSINDNFKKYGGIAEIYFDHFSVNFRSMRVTMVAKVRPMYIPAVGNKEIAEVFETKAKWYEKTAEDKPKPGKSFFFNIETVSPVNYLSPLNETTPEGIPGFILCTATDREDTTQFATNIVWNDGAEVFTLPATDEGVIDTPQPWLSYALKQARPFGWYGEKTKVLIYQKTSKILTLTSYKYNHFKNQIIEPSWMDVETDMEPAELAKTIFSRMCATLRIDGEDENGQKVLELLTQAIGGGYLKMYRRAADIEEFIITAAPDKHLTDFLDTKDSWLLGGILVSFNEKILAFEDRKMNRLTGKPDFLTDEYMKDRGRQTSNVLLGSSETGYFIMRRKDALKVDIKKEEE